MINITQQPQNLWTDFLSGLLEKGFWPAQRSGNLQPVERFYDREFCEYFFGCFIWEIFRTEISWIILRYKQELSSLSVSSMARDEEKFGGVCNLIIDAQ